MQVAATRGQGPVLRGAIEEPPTVGELVLDRLREAVMSGEIRPGARLRQVALADALGVSRMPVRDAITALVAESLLVEVPGGGVMVPVLTPAEQDGLLSLRELLERHALQVLGDRPATAREGAVGEGPTPGPGAVREHIRFHRTLCESVGDRHLSSALATVWPSLERVMSGAGDLPQEVIDSDAALRRLLLVGQHRRAAAAVEEQFLIVRGWLDPGGREAPGPHAAVG
ncbi:MAG: hypothetical protein DCC50_01630 [Acidobacteria bacterium]|nr:MAG: hypothetical protein DCC50_01630 [Acidobacteriota bacterium]